MWTVFAFGLASAAVAGLLRTSWLRHRRGRRARPRRRVASRLRRAHGRTWRRPRKRLPPIVATVLAAAFAHFVAPLSIQTVVIAALIVLMPGLTLTTAVTELATGQLVTGTARFAGAMVVLFKLTSAASPARRS